MAAYRRAFVGASKILKQGNNAVRICSKSVLQTQARCFAVQQSSLVKRVSYETLTRQGQQNFAVIPRMASSALLTTVTASVDSGLISAGSSGSSEVLESSGGDDEGLVTPARDDEDDL